MVIQETQYQQPYLRSSYVANSWHYKSLHPDIIVNAPVIRPNLLLVPYKPSLQTIVDFSEVISLTLEIITAHAY
jgi:hypothetical protein